jgi:hypothetical protein
MIVLSRFQVGIASRTVSSRTADNCSAPREPCIQRVEHSSRFGDAFAHQSQTLRWIDVTLGFTTAPLLLQNHVLQGPVYGDICHGLRQEG